MATPLRRSSSSPQILDIPPRVLEELCRCIDCLNDWEWRRFASYVITDQTSIQRFWMKRKVGDSMTREVLWSWGQKLATVQDLEAVLHNLELYRALDILSQCSFSSDKINLPHEKKTVRGSGAEEERKQCPSVTAKDSAFEAKSLPSPPSPPPELLKSLRLESDADTVSSTEEALSVPQQEISLSANASCQHWTPQQLEEATGQFSADRKIHSGQFADVFIGRKGDRVYAIKRLKEMEGETEKLHSFFQTEAQISFRCSHPNVLRLLGFCVENSHHCLVYQFMKNGSLDINLQEVGSCILSWHKRLGIATGLLQAVHHLHEAGIYHGNIRSSNVFLDDDFSPKLGHSRSCLRTDRSASYTHMKTCEVQKYQPYLPDSFLRSRHLSAHTDIFSSGVVLAEIMSGQKAYDKSRDPANLKDVILSEMEQAKIRPQSNCNKKETTEHLCAKEISLKYVDTKPGRLPADTAIHLASAICLCLTKKKVLLSEVIAMMEKAEDALRLHSKDSQVQLSSVNIPEESDESLSIGFTHGQPTELPSNSFNAPRSLNSASNSQHPAAHEALRSPCELDESGHYLLSPAGIWYDTGTEPSTGGPSCITNHHLQVHSAASETPTSPTGSSEPSWGIQLNNSKKKLLENIELYEDKKADSSVLFDSA